MDTTEFGDKDSPKVGDKIITKIGMKRGEIKEIISWQRPTRYLVRISGTEDQELRSTQFWLQRAAVEEQWVNNDGVDLSDEETEVDLPAPVVDDGLVAATDVAEQPRGRARAQDPLVADGKTWKEVDSFNDTGLPYLGHAASIYRPGVRETLTQRPMDYFLIMYPYFSMHLSAGTDMGVTMDELHRAIGCRLAYTLRPYIGGIRQAWSRADFADSTQQCGDFGRRFGLSRERFESIEALYRNPCTDMERAADPWTPARPYIQLFNKRRKDVLRPGQFIVVEKCMSGFDQGINQFHATKKCPHLQKIKGKPVPVGIEMKASCDCETGILMHLEIQEGKERMASKAYTDIYSNASTACTSRLTFRA